MKYPQQLEIQLRNVDMIFLQLFIDTQTPVVNGIKARKF